MHSPKPADPDGSWSSATVCGRRDAVIQTIRNNVITLITPVVESRRPREDGRYVLLNKKTRQGQQQLPPDVLGQVRAARQHRDGMGQFLALTRNVEKANLEWKPQVLHDLHEAQTYLYSSTAPALQTSGGSITVNEW